MGIKLHFCATTAASESGVIFLWIVKTVIAYGDHLMGEQVAFEVEDEKPKSCPSHQPTVLVAAHLLQNRR